MADITAAMVMKLRDETGLPMMDCKKALQETGGDFELAKQKARESGKKIMSIRQDRSTEEGRIAVIGQCYWYRDYQIIDEIEELRQKHVLVFQGEGN